MCFLLVEFPDSEQTMELPLEDDDTLLLTTLKSNFPNANGYVILLQISTFNKGT